jgi:hypothetical protein
MLVHGVHLLLSFRLVASRATFALNAAEWFRLGFLMDFIPPVTLAPGQPGNLISCRAVSGGKPLGDQRHLGERTPLRKPERASSQGWILDVN